MPTFVVTGTTGDVGLELCHQLLQREETEVTKLIVTARTEEKCKTVIDKLVTSVGGNTKSRLDSCVLDLSELSSIMDAVKNLPQVDRIVLNAGGFGVNKLHKNSVATDTMVSNTLGHSVLVDELIKVDKLKQGARVLYVGSEVSRNAWAFFGFLPHYYSFGKDDLDWAISTNYDFCTTCCPIRMQMGDYKNSKIIGQLHMVGMAKMHPDIHFMSVSPGAVGGSFLDEGHFPFYLMKPAIPTVFRCLNATHSIPEGVSRFMDGVLIGENKWETGAMKMSGYGGCCCLWGARGSAVDNRNLGFSYLNDVDLGELATTKVKNVQDEWFKAEGMSR